LGTALTNQNFIHVRNKEHISLGECLLSFSADSFVFQSAIQNIKTSIYRITILTFC